jgi:hypothetical protein
MNQFIANGGKSKDTTSRCNQIKSVNDITLISLSQVADLLSRITAITNIVEQGTNPMNSNRYTHPIPSISCRPPAKSLIPISLSPINK